MLIYMYVYIHFSAFTVHFCNITDLMMMMKMDSKKNRSMYNL